ncbi:MAG: SDR family NAD(P)-dependent oxidoreductase [Lachnospiraceae bacterium]|nr:SDR family NAD(P)-dependent oxidoreductase [Lachnospiraceae bacterium]
MNKKRIAIVTGASSGLGKEFARRISHYQAIEEVWCIARQPEKLQKTAEELGVKIRTFSIDLSRKEQIMKFQKNLKQEKVSVKILVNSAGFAKFCSYDDLSLDRSLNMIDVNIKGVVAMGLICIPYMGKGSHIINIASIASFQPLPYLNLYSATKAFIKNYSRALNVELKDRGIHVTTVCPGWIRTALYQRANIGARKTIHHFHCMTTPDKVARQALRDAAAGKDLSVYGYSNKLCHLMSTLLPHKFIMKVWLFYQNITPSR